MKEPTKQEIEVLRRPKKRGRPAMQVGCTVCRKEKHYAKGMGIKCYQRAWKRKCAGDTETWD